MAIRHEVDSLRRLVRLTHVSRTPLALWQAAIDTVLTDPAFQRGFDFIDDLTVRVDVPTTVDIRNAIAFLASRQASIAPCRWAIAVHPHIPAIFGMIRMGEGLMEGSPIRLRGFTSVGQALTWLGPRPVTELPGPS
jgi:hypothetical protein